jgi:hypothetical protein
LLEENDSIVVHQIFQELLFLGLEERATVVLEVTHLLDFSVVVIDAEISLRPVDDHDHTFLDVLEGLE